MIELGIKQLQSNFNTIFCTMLMILVANIHQLLGSILCSIYCIKVIWTQWYFTIYSYYFLNIAYLLFINSTKSPYNLKLFAKVRFCILIRAWNSLYYRNKGLILWINCLYFQLFILYIMQQLGKDRDERMEK